MTVGSLSPEAQRVVRGVLAFISTTRLLDGEFETRLGVTRGELAATLMRWPRVDDRADNSSSAISISNALNEIVNGLVLTAEDWRQLGFTLPQVKSAYAEWATKRG